MASAQTEVGVVCCRYCRRHFLFEPAWEMHEYYRSAAGVCQDY